VSLMFAALLWRVTNIAPPVRQNGTSM
jgi:hypothetical protein